MKKVFLYSTSPFVHSLYRIMAENPPEGYEIIKPEITEKGKKEASLRRKLQDNKIARFLNNTVRKKLLNPIKKDLENSKNIELPEGTDLVFSMAHVVEKDVPWIVEVVDRPTALAGHDLNLLKRNKKRIEEGLASKNCKAILCYDTACKESFDLLFDTSKFKEKLQTLFITVTPQENYEKSYEKKEKVKFLFMGSKNNPFDFDIKGGRMAIAMFKELREKRDDVEMTVRSMIPEEIKEECKKIPDLKIYDQELPWDDILQMYKDADVYVYPAHFLNALAPMEAMSFELPIITLNTCGNGELIEDGKNGFVIKPSENIEYKKYFFDLRNKQFVNQVNTIDPRVLHDLVKAADKLASDPKLRKKMGKQGREWVETGKHSIIERNKKLKKIFDQALA